MLFKSFSSFFTSWPHFSNVEISPCRRKKFSLSLLEIIIAMTILGFLLTALFNCFQQGLKKNIAAKDLKQTVLQLELFQQRLKNIFSGLVEETSLTVEHHPEAYGQALLMTFEQSADPEPDLSGTLQGMLFLNKNKQLCLASWAESGKGRIEILLDKIDVFKCQLFDAKKAEWVESSAKKQDRKIVMVKIDLKWKEQETPFVFFLHETHKQITYSGSP